MSGMSNNFDPKKHTIFVPRNPDKYIGKNRIISRSSWESNFMRWLDNTDAVLQWCSECIVILYQDPNEPIKKGKPNIRKYYPDFYVLLRNRDNQVEKFVVEVKPKKETKAPRKNKDPRRMLLEQQTYRKNTAKWKAAENFCRVNGMKFMLITEDQLFGRKG